MVLNGVLGDEHLLCRVAGVMTRCEVPKQFALSGAQTTGACEERESFRR